jgi:hypothetical protein
LTGGFAVEDAQSDGGLANSGLVSNDLPGGCENASTPRPPYFCARPILIFSPVLGSDELPSSPYVPRDLIREDVTVDRTPNSVTGASRAPSGLTFRLMSEPEAEQLLAAVWCILEDYALTSPILRVRLVNPFIEMSLIFASAADCALVENSLPDRDPLEDIDVATFDTLVSIDTATIRSIH